MIAFKEGVRIDGIRPEAVLGIAVAHSVYAQRGYPVMVVTSVVDGQHSAGSLHYSGNAFDLRTRTLRQEDINSVAEAIRNALPREFDVLVESTHIHVEFQPKIGVNL